MKKKYIIHQFILALFSLLGLVSCGEETFTKKTVSFQTQGDNFQVFELGKCASSHLIKPPVDILYVVDNSGSTNTEVFQSLKSSLVNTLSLISSEFDYHLYLVPLHDSDQSSAQQQSYPLVLNNPSSVPSLGSLNVKELQSITSDLLFGTPQGGSAEFGIQRVVNIIQNNRSNGIFRNNSNLVVTLISNEDDSSFYQFAAGYNIFNPSSVATKKNDLINLAQNTLNSSSFRFNSIVAHSQCASGYQVGQGYKEISQGIYDHYNYADDPVNKNSYDLCSGQFNQIFTDINTSIRQVLVGHKYDHWLISLATDESLIKADEISVTKYSSPSDQNGVELSQSSTEGFEYLGFRSNQMTRYATEQSSNSPGEPVTGLVIKLNGSARLSYPECIRAITRSPLEYYGYVVLPREPDLSSLTVRVNNNKVEDYQYLGYRESLNIKVPGPDNVSILPAKNESGYAIQLTTPYSHNDSVEVFYKPASL